MTQIEQLFNTLLSTPISEQCDPGDLRFTGYTRNTSDNDGATQDSTTVNFRWHNSHFSCLEFFGAYLNIETFETDSSAYTEPGASLRVPGWHSHTLFAFNSRCQGFQSSYYIIIVDRDLNFSDMPEDDHLTEDLPGEEPIFRMDDSDKNIITNVFPNPVFNTSFQVELQLDTPQDISIYLFDLGTGKLHTNLLHSINLKKGLHLYQLDASNIPPGIYSLVLQTNQKIYSERLVKLE